MFGLLQIGAIQIQQQQLSKKKKKNNNYIIPRPNPLFGRNIFLGLLGKNRFGYKRIGIRDRYIQQRGPSIENRPRVYNFDKIPLSYSQYSLSGEVLSDIYKKLKNRQSNDLQTISSKSSVTTYSSPSITFTNTNIQKAKTKLIVDDTETEIQPLFFLQMIEQFDILKMTPVYSFEFLLPINIYEVLEKTYEKYLQFELYDSSNNRVYFNKFYIVDVQVKSISDSDYKVYIYQLENKYIQLLNDYNFYYFEKKTIDEILNFISNKYGLKVSTTEDTKVLHLNIPKYSNINLVEFLKILSYYTQNKNSVESFYKSFLRNNTIYLIHNNYKYPTVVISQSTQPFSPIREYQDINSLLFLTKLNYQFYSLNQFEEKEIIQNFKLIDHDKLYNGPINYFVFNDYSDINTLPEINEINFQKWLRNNLKKIQSIDLMVTDIPNFSIFSKLKFENSQKIYTIVGYELIIKNNQIGNISRSVKLYFV